VVLAVSFFAKWGDRLQGHLFSSNADSYRIAASFHRNDHGKLVPLVHGDRVSPGDAISLELTVSESLFVYVVNRDEASNTFLLFPSPGVSPRNPLPPGHHALPGSIEGQHIDWQVTTAGGAETYWVIVSRTRPLDLELELFSLPQPAIGSLGSSTDDRYAGDQRGTGGFVPAPRADIGAQLRSVLEASTELDAEEELASGLWARRLVLENPVASP